LAVSVSAGPKEEETHSFDGIKKIRISTVSGDCVIHRGTTDKVEVNVVWSYRPRDSYRPEFREQGEVLKLSEDIYRSNSGYSTWTLAVPNDMEVRFNSASGGLEIDGVDGDFSLETASGDAVVRNCEGQFDFNTASGDIELSNCKGRLDLNTASGDIELENCTGEFEIATASGSVRADGVVLNDASAFSTASGRVRVSLGATAEHDLRVSTASGSAVLDYAGHPIKGYFEFSSKERGGRVSAPYAFEDEERYRRWGDRYVRSWFSRESDQPQVFVETASGRATLTE
jgi:DUF4097 and DUF4098 domain-containing protein YvlB